MISAGNSMTGDSYGPDANRATGAAGDSAGAQDYSWITRDTRYSRIDPDEFPPQVMEAIGARLINERVERRRLLDELRDGVPLRTVLMDESVGTLRMSDIVETLPHRTESVSDTMIDLGFLENCPLDFLSDVQREKIVVTIEQSGLAG